jgi:hypothetical protein
MTILLKKLGYKFYFLIYLFVLNLSCSVHYEPIGTILISAKYFTYSILREMCLFHRFAGIDGSQNNHAVPE